MGKKEELMNQCIRYDLYANNQLPRYYIVDRIRYDFESGGWYSVKDLNKTGEMKKYGTLEGAKNYALRLYEKYHKELGEDMDIRIREEIIVLSKLQKQLVKREVHEFCINKLSHLKTLLREHLYLMQDDNHSYLVNAVHWSTIVDIIEKEMDTLKMTSTPPSSPLINKLKNKANKTKHKISKIANKLDKRYAEINKKIRNLRDVDNGDDEK